MKKIIFCLIASFFLLSACGKSQKEIPNQNSEVANTAENNKTETPPPLVSSKEMQCLVEAYPDFLSYASDNLIVWKDGTSMIYDDRQEEPDFETRLNQASLKDQMSLCYAKEFALPAIDFDPGRIRHEPFFYKMYGSSEAEVRTKITEIDWLPQNFEGKVKLKVTTLNGIDKKFKAVSDELDALPKEYLKYLENPGGTFNWRTIAGTTRISTHSFGMTIDINVAHSNYWRNDEPNEKGIYKYKNSIPPQIVEIFEKYGFIWGGKWYHYDTMHFEYRPELLSEKCLCR